MRKILLILILTFVSLLAFVSCENEEEKESIVGTSWVWHSGGVTICFIDEYYATKTYRPYAVLTREYTYDAESQDGVIGGFIFTIRGNILTCNNIQYYKQ
jgi:hypothetical protein